MALDSRAPPVANKLAHTSTSALSPSTLQYLRRYCNKKNIWCAAAVFLCPTDEAGYHAPPSNPMRHGRIPNRKLQNPHTIASRERFRTKPRRSPQRHHESQRLDRRDRKAAAADQAAASIYRVGTAYYQPTPAGYLVALPNLISATKNRADEEPFSTVKSILGCKVDTQGTESDESLTSAFGESNDDSNAADPDLPELGRRRW